MPYKDPEKQFRLTRVQEAVSDLAAKVREWGRSGEGIEDLRGVVLDSVKNIQNDLERAREREGPDPGRDRTKFVRPTSVAHSLLRLIAEGQTPTAAAAALGCKPHSVRVWARRKANRDAVEAAKAEAIAEIRVNIFREAKRDARLGLKLLARLGKLGW